MSKPRSLLLATVDCFRADHAGFLGYARPTTPFLDSLASQCVVFENAIVSGAPTYYSLPGILASRGPLAWGRDVVGLAPREPTLASCLRELGYSTGAFSAANPYVSTRFNYQTGFDTFCDFLDTTTSEQPVVDRVSASRFNRTFSRMAHTFKPLGMLYDEMYFEYCQRVTPAPPSIDSLRPFPSADVLVTEAENWLAENRSGPVFLWLHFMDPHAPYCPPAQAMADMGVTPADPYRARYLNSYWNRADLTSSRLKRHRDEVVSLYDSGIRWVDTQLGRLVEGLKSSGQWDDCIFAVTADHGEEFLDHEGRYHAPEKLGEELIRVPLLLRVPDCKNPERVQAPFSLVNLAPTLLHAMDVEPPPEFRGSNRWPALQKAEQWNDQAIVECVGGCTNPFRKASRMGSRLLAVRERRYKLIMDFRTSKQFLFDLENDPNELNPIAENTERPTRRRLLEAARSHLADSAAGRSARTSLAARWRDFQLEWAHPESGDRA